MQHDIVLTFWPEGSRGLVCWQNICYHVDAFVIPFNLICNMTIFWKSWILTCWPHPQDRGRICGHNMALATVRTKAVVLLLLIECWLLLQLWDSVIVLCFAVRYFMSILVLQSSWWGRESWLLYFDCLTGVSWLLCRSSSRCNKFVCSLWLWYFLLIFTFFFLTGRYCITPIVGVSISANTC